MAKGKGKGKGSRSATPIGGRGGKGKGKDNSGFQWGTNTKEEADLVGTVVDGKFPCIRFYVLGGCPQGKLGRSCWKSHGRHHFRDKEKAILRTVHERREQLLEAEWEAKGSGKGKEGAGPGKTKEGKTANAAGKNRSQSRQRLGSAQN